MQRLIIGSCKLLYMEYGDRFVADLTVRRLTCVSLMTMEGLVVRCVLSGYVALDAQTEAIRGPKSEDPRLLLLKERTQYYPCTI